MSSLSGKMNIESPFSLCRGNPVVFLGSPWPNYVSATESLNLRNNNRFQLLCKAWIFVLSLSKPKTEVVHCKRFAFTHTERPMWQVEEGGKQLSRQFDGICWQQFIVPFPLYHPYTTMVTTNSASVQLSVNKYNLRIAGLLFWPFQS